MSADQKEIEYGFNTPFGRVAVQHLLTSDPEHPLVVLACNTLTIVLKGGFWEHTLFDPATGKSAIPMPKSARFCPLSTAHDYVMMRCWRGPGSVLRRSAEFQCRRELPAKKTSWMFTFAKTPLPIKS